MIRIFALWTLFGSGTALNGMVTKYKNFCFNKVLFKTRVISTNFATTAVCSRYLSASEKKRLLRKELKEKQKNQGWMELIASELFSARVTVVPPPGEGDVTRYDHCRGSCFIKGWPE